MGQLNPWLWDQVVADCSREHREQRKRPETRPGCAPPLRDSTTSQNSTGGWEPSMQMCETVALQPHVTSPSSKLVSSSGSRKQGLLPGSPGLVQSKATSCTRFVNFV